MISESYKSKKKISEWSSAPILSLSLFIDYYFFHLSIKIRNEFTKKHQFDENIFFSYTIMIFIISNFSFTLGSTKWTVRGVEQTPTNGRWSKWQKGIGG